MENLPVLEVKNLVTTFHSAGRLFRAVDNVSFTLREGETTAIVGESGSGKSVTSLSILRLLAKPLGRIEQGEIVYYHHDGSKTDLVGLSEEEMRQYRGHRMAMIFQEPMSSLNPVITCGEQVAEAIRLHKGVSKEEAREKTISLFEEVQLPVPEQMFDRYPHQLSGGQKQRVMIAMAMSCEPRLLIADEPTTALDVTVQKTILELMKKLQSRYKMAILFITHDLGVVSELADEVLVMYKGKLMEKGSVRDLFLRPQHPYTKSLLACKPPLDTRPERLSVVGDFLELDESGQIIGPAKEKKSAENTVSSNGHHGTLREKLLEVRGLKTKFPSKKSLFGSVKEYTTVLDGLTFDVYKGETLGLVGESGCGKTTLGRAVLKLVQADEGEIIYDGRNIGQMEENAFRSLRPKMQIIFQDPYSSLNPRVMVGEAIAEPMRVHGLYRNEKERRDKVMELLHKVGLDKKQYQQYPHEFSGGQRQRLCIARALALQPEFIICDESVSALDVSVQAQVLNLINDLKREYGFTSIFISHDLAVVKYMSDRMMVMRKGRIEELGDPEEIYSNPRSEYTQTLIKAIPKILS